MDARDVGGSPRDARHMARRTDVDHRWLGVVGGHAARFALADLIVVPDYPLAQHREWALQRQAEVERGERRDWPPPGCDAALVIDEMLALIDLVESDFMPRVRDMLQGLAHKTVRARSPEVLDGVARSLEVGRWPVGT
jgi:hypothetical protein